MTVAVRERARTSAAAKRRRPAAPDFAAYPHVAKAAAYARGVIVGEIPAGRYVRLACERWERDLERSLSDDYPYRLDPERAERNCAFVECFSHTKGKWAGMPYVLEPWQCFRRVNVFGWVRKEPELVRREDGSDDAIYPRRFRRYYWEVPRKNGKSLEDALDGLYCFAADGEDGAECYCGATTEKQAWEVFRPARLMALRSAEFLEAFGVEVHAKALSILANASRFEPLIGKPGDGASPHWACADEYHEHTTDDYADTMLTGMMARVQPLFGYSTTAGDDIEGPCYAVREEAIRVLERQEVNEELWAIVYTIDDGTDWTSELALRMANPNHGVSVNADLIRKAQIEATRNPRKQGVFKTKHLDVWVADLSAFFNMEDWKRCANPSLRLENVASWGPGWEPVLCLDMAAKIDFSSAAFVFRSGDRWRLIVKHYLPEETALDPSKQHYLAWVESGHVHATEGGEIDFGFVEDELSDLVRMVGARRLGYDPAYAVEVTQKISANTGIERIEMPMGQAVTFSAAMVEVEAALKTGRFEHDGNPATEWHFANIVAKEDRRGNYYPRRRTKAKKIDGAVASLLGVNLLLVPGEESDDKDEATGYLI